MTAFSLLIPITLYHFCITLAGLQARWSLILGYLIAFVLAALLPFDLIMDGVRPKLDHRFWPNAGVLMPAYLSFFILYLVASGWMLFKGWERHIGGLASDNVFVFFTCFVGFGGGVTNFPLWYDIPFEPYGNILVSVYLFLLGQGLYNKRITGLGMDIYKAAVGMLLSVTVTFFYILYLTIQSSFFGERLEVIDLWQKGAIVFLLSVLVFWLVPSIRFRTEKLVEGVFRHEWSTALSTLST
ncbi:MAG: hypothetical protein AAF546_04615, partial [Verrucomicrobiota bacterium]